MTGIGGLLSYNWGTGAPVSAVQSDNFSSRWTGDITFPSPGTYAFRFLQDDGVRLFIDDKVIVDSWINTNGFSPTGTVLVDPGTEVRRIRIDHFEGSVNSAMTLYWDRLGDAQPEVAVPVSALSPNYGLVTTTTVDDAVTYSPPSVTTTSYFADPALGLPLTTTINPGGLALATTNTYETYAIGSATGRRLKSRTMPSGASWSYDYWGNAQVTGPADTTCVQGQSVNQAGLLRKKVHPGASLTEEYVYDAAGRQVGYRKNSDPWTCSTYNARGELTQVAYPAIGGFSGSARTVSFSQGAASTVAPLGFRTWRSSVSDPSVDAALCSSGPCGTMVVDEDWMGRVVGYHDGTTQTLNTFDGAGRPMSTSSGVGVVREYGYDSASRLLTVKLNGVTLSTSAYDGNGELSSVAYANSSALSSITRDGQGRARKLTWTKAGAPLAVDEITGLSQSGRIRTSTSTLGSSSVASEFRYDGAGRLVKAIVGATTYDYSFAASSCAGPAVSNAGLNSNRTSVTTNASTVVFCYDAADRLVSGTGLGTIAYNSHGDTTALGGGTYSWDVAGRNTAWTGGAVTTTYVRDAADRVRRRVLTGGSGQDWRPGFDGPGDSPAFIKTASGVLAQIIVALPGGVTYMANLSPATTEPSVWSYPDLRGNTMFSTDTNATVSAAGLQTYSPDGKPRAGSFDTNYVGTTFYGWHGQAARPQEQNGDIIQMGARPYLTTIGRFLTIDPIEAGTPNDYVYPADPVNQNDLDGKKCRAGEEVGRFYDRHRRFVILSASTTYYLCQGRLQHINDGGHFGGKLLTSDYAQRLVAATIDDGFKTRDTRRGRDNTDFEKTFHCMSPDLSKYVFSFTVRVSVGNSGDRVDNIQNAFILGNDYLDQMDPDLIDASCKAGRVP